MESPNVAPALELFLRTVEKNIFPIMEIISQCLNLAGHPEKLNLSREGYLNMRSFLK